MLSMAFGAPVLAIGNYINNPNIVVAGTLLVPLIGLVCCLSFARKQASSLASLGHVP